MNPVEMESAHDTGSILFVGRPESGETFSSDSLRFTEEQSRSSNMKYTNVVLGSMLAAMTFSIASVCAEEHEKESVTAEKKMSKGHGEKTPAYMQPARRWQKVSDVTGKPVQVNAGENIGKVENLIIDDVSGRILFVIISCDGKFSALPPSKVELQESGKKFMLSCTKDQVLANAFEKDAYPNFSDVKWSTGIYSHYKVRPYWENPDQKTNSDEKEKSAEAKDKKGAMERADSWYRMPKRWAKTSDFIGKGVKNPDGEDLGKVDDIVIDPDNWRITYGVLSFGGFLGIGDDLFALPWSSLELKGNAEVFTLNIDKERLQKAEGFDKDNWPNMADERWATGIYKYFEQEPYWSKKVARAE
jgi:sporulation protein YlmC with PRC-barrel domain